MIKARILSARKTPIGKFLGPFADVPDAELGVVQMGMDGGVRAGDGELERGRVDSDARLLVG